MFETYFFIYNYILIVHNMILLIFYHIAYPLCLLYLELLYFDYFVLV